MVSRASAEAILVRRCGALLTAAGLDGTTVNGTNADLNDPLGVGLRKLGHSVANIADVSDTDLSGVASDEVDAFLDVCELRTLETIHGNLDDVNIAVGPRREDLGTLASQVAAAITRLTERIQKEYGLALAGLEPGLVDLNFSERLDDPEMM